MATLRYTLPEDVNTVRARIAAEIEDSFFLLPWRPHKLFLGEVRHDGFSLRPVPKDQNSFRRVAVGRFNSSPEGTIIEIEFCMPVGIQLFMGFWCAGLTLAIGIGVLIADTIAEKIMIGSIGSLMLLFAIGIIHWSGKYIIDEYEPMFNDLFGQPATRIE